MDSFGFVFFLHMSVHCFLSATKKLHRCCRLNAFTSGFILVLSVEAHVSLSVRGGFPHSFLVAYHHLLGHRYCTDQVLFGLAMWLSWCMKYLSLQLQRRWFCRTFSILMLISRSLLHVLHVHVKTFHQAAVEEIMEMFVD